MGKSEMRWYISKRVLLVEHYGNITVETLRDVNAEMTQYLEDGDAPVHVISDSSQMDDFPTNVNQIRKIQWTILNDDRWGWMVAVGVNSMVRFLVAVMSSIFGLRIKTADSIEEAEKILRRVEPRIADAEVITAEAQTDEAAAASATVSDDTQTDETDSDSDEATI